MKSIEILAVLDTQFILSGKLRPSLDPLAPQSLDFRSGYFMASNPFGKTYGNASTHLILKARRGAKVNFRATDLTLNGENAVLIYKLEHQFGKKALKRIKGETVVIEDAALSNPDSINGLPAVSGESVTECFSAHLRKKGEERLFLAFGLYTLSEDGQSQNLYGYYQIALTLDFMFGKKKMEEEPETNTGE